MNRQLGISQLAIVTLMLSACGGGSSSNPDSDMPGTTSGLVEDGGSTQGDDMTGGEEPVVDMPVDPVPVVLTSENAVFLDVPYTQARSDLDNIVTGNLYPGNLGIENFFSFAIDPVIVDELVSGARADCALGGTIDYLFEAESGPTAAGGFISSSRQFTYTNCGLENGLVDGVIEINFDESQSGTATSKKTLTTFDVMLNSLEAQATLTGQHLTERLSTFVFNPNCGEITTVTENSSLILDNSTINSLLDSPRIHYYSTLSHTQTDLAEKFCSSESEAFVETTTFDSAATYTQTRVDEITSYQLDKSGDLQSLVIDSNGDHEPARLVATVETVEPATHTLSITADNLLGSPLTIVIDSGDSMGTFIEELSFENLSN